MEKRILTIQDISCVGQCSLTVALPILSACGFETAVLPSAVLSTHTAGFHNFTSLNMTEEFPKIIKHWISEGITFDGVYTGYIFSEQVNYVNEICKKLNNGPKIIDPVMGDDGSFYYGFDFSFAEKMGQLCRGADVILPNITEAAFLLGEKPRLSGYDKKYIELMMSDLSKKFNVDKIIITGVSFDDTKLGVAMYSGSLNQTAYYFSYRISQNFHGTGDIYSSAFTAAYLNGKSLYDSAAIAVDYTVKAMELTLDDKEKHPYGVFFEEALPFLIGKIKY